ncbi:phosphatidate phosphatase PAH1 isoform X2 [Abrus precatorius]|uniref:phosphatidate phosphatase n=1 Tax=Abrus precatorius TaxID=3816 RepID=A0A8B8M4R1_ABRPR|nr:phosphatidate phosphatase PAH1 isoform X2 [Abrus precatorius]
MNVVGKVGSLITQGVYSVATPFHPFGGAVDVIVVQQQDGAFRSTPWYVRFGKFQGVLKGAEKIVRINVNGVEANFHMYLDNSGEAYFLKEVDDDKGVESDEVVQDSISQNNSYLSNGHRLDHSISDSGVLRLKDEGDSSAVPLIQRAESDVDRRFYEFPDDPSSFEDSVELSEYGSNSYESLEGEIFVDSQSSHPEMVLVSVDGHILTAPISESEQNEEENVQLKTPQFHLGPGEETDLCEGNGEFSSGENAWAADYISQLDAPTVDVQSGVQSIHRDTNGDDITSKLPLEVCQVEEVHICQPQETLEIKDQELHMESDSERVESGIKRENVFKSCLELQEFGQQDGNADLEDVGSSLVIQNSAEESNANCLVVDENEQESIVQSRNVDELLPPNGSTSNGHRSPKSELEIQEKNASEVESAPASCSNTTDIEQNDEHLGKSVSNYGVDGSQKNPALEDVRTTSEVVEPQTETSNEDQNHSSLGFEISLCGHELKAGMGSVAAAEVFEAHRISAVDFMSSAPSVIKNQNLVIKFKERYLMWEKAAHLVLGMAVFGLDLPVEPKDTIPVEQDALKSRDDDPGTSSAGRRWRLWPIPFRKVKTTEHTNNNSPNEEVFLDSESGSLADPTPTSSTQGSPHKQFLRTNVPTNEQIASLNLKDGQNLVTFSFSTRVLGTQQVDAHIYLWKWNARIVISDVDGTITKSDVLGQFMPLVGKDWTQSGVARLFSAIKDGKTLPNGPVVISPDGLFPSLYREVIRRAPHEFKIACLEDIKRLFPSDYNPFYAGFGNRDTDELSYRKIGIPKGKIFIINPKGEVATSHRIGTKSYTSLHTLVNDMFPPTSLVEQEDFNSWNYWKTPLPDID